MDPLRTFVVACLPPCRGQESINSGPTSSQKRADSCLARGAVYKLPPFYYGFVCFPHRKGSRIHHRLGAWVGFINWFRGRFVNRTLLGDDEVGRLLNLCDFAWAGTVSGLEVGALTLRGEGPDQAVMLLQA